MLFVTIVLDGVGIGEQPDAYLYGDEGSDTLGHVLAQCRPSLPHFAELGLGSVRPLAGIPPVPEPTASFGKMMERSAGKDSTTGHWELSGIHLDQPFPTYPDGFPVDVIARFCERVGVNGVLGNRPKSGTVIIEECGDQHMRTGMPIVYTSADSVYQIAAHVDVIPLDELYRMCRIAREEICVGEHGVGRVIARPFEGSAGAFSRISSARKDFSRLPHVPPVQQILQQAGVQTISVGKVADLFGGVGFDRTTKTTSNAHGMDVLLEEIQTAEGNTFVWVNLIDFDQEFGHRLNPEGFAASLEEFDRFIPTLLAALPEQSRLVVTADHGNDPTGTSTDHSREYVPLLYTDQAEPRDLGIRSSFADHAATVAHVFGVPFETDGTSFESS